MTVSDILIHIAAPLSAEARSSLEDALRGIEGVIAPRFGVGTDHLLLVAFDADKNHPATLLAEVRRSVGQAQLVGL